MRITFWLVILFIAIFIYAFIGIAALQECVKGDTLARCLLVKVQGTDTTQ